MCRSKEVPPNARDRGRGGSNTQQRGQNKGRRAGRALIIPMGLINRVVSANLPVKVQQSNPKKHGSKSSRLYERCVTGWVTGWATWGE